MQVQQRAQIALMHAIAAVSHAEMNAATGAIATHVTTLDRKLLVWGRPQYVGGVLRHGGGTGHTQQRHVR